jgi:uncharacterized membrane protein
MENPNNRLEYFCDAVFAIAMTLLIIEIEVPPAESVHSKEELWAAFADCWPSWLAFIVSFITILISWVTHSNGFKLINKSSPRFVYANCLLLLSIIILPYFTEAVAAYLPTDYAQPAITLYCGVSLFQSISWNIVRHLTLHPESLYRPDVNLKKIKKLRAYTKLGLVLYSLTFIISFWFPVTAFVIISLSYLVWLVVGISLKEEKMTN